MAETKEAEQLKKCPQMCDDEQCPECPLQAQIDELAGALEKAKSNICNYELDDCVLAFAKRMQYKLDKNKHKECEIMNPDGKGRGWDNCELAWLIERARQEITELESELLPDGSWDKARFESADVGNFMMMVNDILSKRIAQYKSK